MAIKKNTVASARPVHHVHTGLFAIIGLLILIAVALGGWYYYREQHWSKAFTTITEEKVALEKQLNVYQSNAYDGPYGTLSYVKYAQAQSVASLYPDSRIVNYPQASCSTLYKEGELPVQSTEFGSSVMLGGEVFLAMPEADQLNIKTLIDAQLSFVKEGEKEKSPVYSLNRICVMDADHVLMLGVDTQNNAFRVPLWFSRYDGAWKLQAMPPMLNLFSATTVVRVHPDGSPVLFEVYQNPNIAAWQAYYLDTRYQVIDMIESCRIVKQEGRFIRMCERLYDQVF